MFSGMYLTEHQERAAVGAEFHPHAPSFIECVIAPPVCLVKVVQEIIPFVVKFATQPKVTSIWDNFHLTTETLFGCVMWIGALSQPATLLVIAISDAYFF